jgi:hypothetical protein
MTRYARFLVFTLLIGLAVVPAAQANTHVSVYIGIPSPVVVAPPPVAAPYVGSYWRPGHYEWTRFGYRWVPGHWVASGYARPGWSRRYGSHDRDRYRGHHDWDRGDRYYRR